MTGSVMKPLWLLTRTPANSMPQQSRVVPLSAAVLSALLALVQVRFFEVSEEELEKQRSAFSNGQLRIRIEQQQFSMR